MIKVEIVNTFLVNSDEKEFVILLRGIGEDKRTLPISVGHLEAQSIALQLNGIPFPRPLTHDLLKKVIVELDGKVLRTEITELKDDTFFAMLLLKIGEKILSIESRPSDAIAMALRFGAPVFVDEKVMEEAGVILPETAAEINEQKKDPVADDRAAIASGAQPVGIEALRLQLKKAIEKERYEEAAKIRDEINRHNTAN